MSTFYDQLVIIRRFLRDPEANLWGNDLLRAIWDEVSDDFHARTNILMTVRAMPVPPRWQVSITQDWEYEYRPETGRDVHLCLSRNGQTWAYCAPFEAQIAAGIDGDEPGYANGAVTHPWEAWYLLPGEPVAFPQPDDLHAVYGMYYDYDPLYREMWGEILDGDLSWSYHEGEADTWYRRDMVSPAYYLYPRPSVFAAPDAAGDGVVTSVEGDTLDSEYGITVFRDGSTTDGEYGADIDVVDQDENVLMIYSQRPMPITGYGDALPWPDWTLKYLRAGVLERAYRVQGDGQIESLAQHWGSRYELGIQAVSRYKRLKMEDRKYQLSTSTRGYGAGRNRGPRLPSTYPPI
jgi:hypothetical protein